MELNRFAQVNREAALCEADRAENRAIASYLRRSSWWALVTDAVRRAEAVRRLESALGKMRHVGH